MDRHTLVNISLASKAMWNMGAKLLLKDVKLKGISRIQSFCDYVYDPVESRSYCGRIRTLTIAMTPNLPLSKYMPTMEEMDLARTVADVLERSDNLSSLKLFGLAGSFLYLATERLRPYEASSLYILLQAPGRVTVCPADASVIQSLTSVRGIRSLSLSALSSSTPCLGPSTAPLDLSRLISHSAEFLETVMLDLPWLPAHLREDQSFGPELNEPERAENVRTLILRGVEMNYTSLYCILRAFPNVQRLYVSGRQLFSTARHNFYRRVQAPLTSLPSGLRCASLDVRLFVGAGWLPGLQFIDFTGGTRIASNTLPFPIIDALKRTPVKGIALTLYQMNSYQWLSEFVSELDHLEYLDVRVELTENLCWKKAMKAVSIFAFLLRAKFNSLYRFIPFTFDQLFPRNGQTPKSLRYLSITLRPDDELQVSDDSLPLRVARQWLLLKHMIKFVDLQTDIPNSERSYWTLQPMHSDMDDYYEIGPESWAVKRVREKEALVWREWYTYAYVFYPSNRYDADFHCSAL